MYDGSAVQQFSSSTVQQPGQPGHFRSSRARSARKVRNVNGKRRAQRIAQRLRNVDRLKICSMQYSSASIVDTPFEKPARMHRALSA